MTTLRFIFTSCICIICYSCGRNENTTVTESTEATEVGASIETQEDSAASGEGISEEERADGFGFEEEMVIDAEVPQEDNEEVQIPDGTLVNRVSISNLSGVSEFPFQLSKNGLDWVPHKVKNNKSALFDVAESGILYLKLVTNQQAAPISKVYKLRGEKKYFIHWDNNSHLYIAKEFNEN